jgi:hypothetical protein
VVPVTVLAIIVSGLQLFLGKRPSAMKDANGSQGSRVRESKVPGLSERSIVYVEADYSPCSTEMNAHLESSGALCV